MIAAVVSEAPLTVTGMGYDVRIGSTVRTPGVGVYLFDKKQTNMENYGVHPDILVDNSPEDNLKGYDRQIVTATQQLVKEIGSRKRTDQRY